MPQLSETKWLELWLADNGGLCHLCNSAIPSPEPLTCPSGCDLYPLYARASTYVVAGQLSGLLSMPVREQSTLPLVRSLGDLLCDPRLSDPPAFVIPGIVEAGAVTLLSGAPKAGKSTFASQLAAAFSRGRPMFDGRPMGPGTVLWFAVDEPLRRLAQRFKELDADAEKFRVVERGRSPITPEVFEALLDSENPGLVVVDTLSQFAADNGVKVNDAESVVPFFKEIASAIQAREKCGALLLFHAPHHANRASGSVQWGAIADAALVFRRTSSRRARVDGNEEQDDELESDDGGRVLAGISRWAGEQTTMFRYRDGIYGLVDSPSLINRLRSALAEVAPGVGRTSKSALASIVRARDVDVSRALDELVRLGEAKIAGKGKNSYLERTAFVPPVLD